MDQENQIRKGKRYLHVDANGSLFPQRRLLFDNTTYEVVPIRPIGWMVYKDGVPGFGGLVVPYTTVSEWIRSKLRDINKKNRLYGEELCKWMEIDNVDIMEIEAPPEANKTLIVDFYKNKNKAALEAAAAAEAATTASRNATKNKPKQEQVTQKQIGPVITTPADDGKEKAEELDESLALS